MCDMTHSHVWLDPFLCVRRFSHSTTRALGALDRQLLLCHSFICVTCHIHMCDMTHSYGWNVAFICVTWSIHRAPPCNTLQHTATHCNTLQHTAARCNTLQHTVTHCNTLQHTAAHCSTLQHTATHCNTLQLTANTLQHTATHDRITVPLHESSVLPSSPPSTAMFDTTYS